MSDYDNEIFDYTNKPRAKMSDYPEKRGVVCGVCGRGFSPDEWDDRHSEGLEEYHAKHCPKCEPDRAFFITLNAKERMTK